MTITEVHFSSYDPAPVVKNVLFIKKQSIGEVMYAQQHPRWRWPIINWFTKLWIGFAVRWIEQDIHKMYSSYLRKEIHLVDSQMAGKEVLVLGSTHV